MKYNHQKIEKYWQKKWLAERIYEPDLTRAKKPFYNLMMFPYPSAEGLHVGNMYAFVGSDIYGRFKRMQGYDVFEPIGLDGFGIHSENYALKIKKHPAEQAKISEKNFYRQLHEIGNGFAWDERLETYDPEYYKWTQWIFVQMFKHGLAYRKKQAVNWCPGCKTVLADEQVIKKSKIPPSSKGFGRAGKNQKSKLHVSEEEILNICERCETPVIKRELEQWFFRITKYAEKLLKGLEKIDWPEKVKIAQRNWIGRSEGALVKFGIKYQVSGVKEKQMHIEVFTTRPDTIFGATFLALSPENPLITALEFKIKNRKEVTRYIENYIRNTKGKEKNPPSHKATEGQAGIELKGIKALNPATKKEIPVWIADYVLMEYGTGAIMGVPAHDERDFEFAKKYKLPIQKVIRPTLLHLPKTLSVRGFPERLEIKGDVWEGEGELINSGHFDGIASEKARWEIVKFIKGKKEIRYRLRDWLISRQRYWGPPIPMIFCPHCARGKKGERKDMPGWYAVPEKDLPIRLPKIKNFHPKGEGITPLAKERAFYEVKCPKCKSEAVRETDVSDTFLDSAWYYIAYLMQKSKIPPSPPAGGFGRAGKSQNDKSKLKNTQWDRKIVKKWLPVDMYIGGMEHSVLHLLYVRFMARAFHDLGFIDFDEPAKKFRAHGLLIREGAKMSKSKGNIVNPDSFIKEFGADAFRMHLMFLAPFEDGGDFRDEAILGPVRFLERVWRLNQKSKIKSQNDESKIKDKTIGHIVQKTIRKVTEDIENLRYNTAISALMILLNDLEKAPISKEDYEKFLKLLVPFAPHMAEEIWRSVLGRKTSIHREPWPEYDPVLIQEETFTLVIQVNGKVRDTILAPLNITEEEAKKIALGREKIKNILGSAVPQRIIYVPKRLMNIVIAQ